MKKDKLVISMAAAFMAVSAFGIAPVYAEGTGSAADTAKAAEHTITIKNTPNGEQTYTAYKVFDETHNGDKVAYTIEEDSAFYDTVKAYADAGGLKLTKAAGTTNTYVVEKTDKFDAPTFAAKLLADTTKPDAAGSTTTTNGAEGTIKVTGEGYYYINTATGTFASLDSTNDSATVVDKNRDIFTEKDSDGNANYSMTLSDHAVEEDETVNYTIHSVIPATVGYNSYTYTIDVTVPDATILDKDSIEIAYDGATAASSVNGFTVVANDNNTFKVTVDAKTLNGTTGQAALGKKFDITYSGSVDTYKSANNYSKAVLTHSTSPTDATKTETHEVSDHLILGQLWIEKYDGDTSTEDKPVYLAGAQFVIANADGTKFYKHTADSTEWITASSPEAAAEAGATVYTSKGHYGDNIISSFEAADTVHTSDPSTGVQADDTNRGKYKVYEIAAPAGYNVIKDAVDVTVTVPSETVTVATGYAEIANYSGTELPESGGAGTAMIYLVGSLVAGAGVIYVVSRRKKEEVAR